MWKHYFLYSKYAIQLMHTSNQNDSNKKEYYFKIIQIHHNVMIRKQVKCGGGNVHQNLPTDKNFNHNRDHNSCLTHFLRGQIGGIFWLLYFNNDLANQFASTSLRYIMAKMSPRVMRPSPTFLIYGLKF